MSVEWHPDNFRTAYGYTYTSEDKDDPGLFTYVSSEPLRAQMFHKSDRERGRAVSPLERYVPESMLLAERQRADRAVKAFEECWALWVDKSNKLRELDYGLRDIIWGDDRTKLRARVRTLLERVLNPEEKKTP